MDFERHVFSPSSAAEFSGISTEMQRDLRHKGFLENYGRLEKGQRWKYSFRDLVGFAVAGRLIDTGFPRHGSCAMGWTEAPTVFGYLMGAKASSMPHRYVAVLIEGASEASQGLKGEVVTWVGKLEELDSSPAFERAEIIDLKHIAELLHEDLKDLATEITLK